MLGATARLTTAAAPNPAVSSRSHAAGATVALITAVAPTTPAHSGGHLTTYLAPAGYCSGRADEVMICLDDYARRHAGLPPLRLSARLARAARAKSADIARCGFTHTACNRAFEYRIDWAGYRWSRVGENLAWGTGALGRPYAIFSAWLRSAPHRANILDPRFRDLGVAVRNSGSAALWVAEFGRAERR